MGYENSRTATERISSQKIVFVSGLEAVERVGGDCLRFVFFVNEMLNGKLTRVLQQQTVVMPITALPDAIGKSLTALGRQVLVRADGSVTAMH